MIRCYDIGMKYDAIVLAGGKGKRLDIGYNKVFYKMPNGKTILENALSPFLEDIECQRVIVAVSDEDLKKITFEKKMIFARNGKERFFSVYNALKEVKEEYVMIHDGARPYITSLDLNNLKETLKSEDAAMLGIKAKDTIKEVKDGYVLKTLDRDHIYLAQTPQCFKLSIIKELIICFEEYFSIYKVSLYLKGMKESSTVGKFPYDNDTLFEVNIIEKLDRISAIIEGEIAKRVSTIRESKFIKE